MARGILFCWSLRDIHMRKHKGSVSLYKLLDGNPAKDRIMEQFDSKYLTVTVS